MPVRTIWGFLDRVDLGTDGPAFIQIRIQSARGPALRMRPAITERTLIARGTNRIDAARLREGEFVELTYRNEAGKLEAETVYVRPDDDIASSG